jgi:hypothetical protein
MSALEDLTNRSNWDIQNTYVIGGDGSYTVVTWLDGVPPIGEAAAELQRLRAIEAAADFHPRATKLMLKKKNFIVIAEDEPYFSKAYAMIRVCEMAKGTWTEEDERLYRDALAAALQKGE